METFDMLPPVQSFHQSHNCLVNWMNGMRASFSLSLENQKYFVWRHKLVAISATILSSLPPMKRQETSHWIRNKVTSSRSGHWPHLATPSPSYTRPLQNSKAATLGVRSTHLLCISVEEMGGPTTTTHLPTTTTPPSLHHHSTLLTLFTFQQ